MRPSTLSRRLVVRTLRAFSTRNRKHTYALPFSISPEQALEKFQHWATNTQGLQYLLSWNSLQIGASYAPFYAFDVNVRFRKEGDASWKPDAFAVYESQPVVHLPGFASYAGYTFRRSLIHPVHSTSLVFLSDKLVPFDDWMLRDMDMGGNKLSISVDAWNATKGRAFARVRQEFEEMTAGEATVQMELVSSRRVLLPTYYIDYKVWGMEFRAFVSGCDTAAEPSGISHQVFSISPETMQQASSTLFQGANMVSQSRQLAPFLFTALQLFASTLGRLLVRIPLIGVVGGAAVGFRKIVQPWMDNRWATAEWERQREYDAYPDDTAFKSDFEDGGAAERYFRRNKERILRHLSGDTDHSQGSYEWFGEWEAWARRQWEQENQSTWNQGYQQQQQQQSSRQSSRRSDFQWNFDVNDP